MGLSRTDKELLSRNLRADVRARQDSSYVVKAFSKLVENYPARQAKRDEQEAYHVTKMVSSLVGDISKNYDNDNINNKITKLNTLYSDRSQKGKLNTISDAAYQTAIIELENQKTTNASWNMQLDNLYGGAGLQTQLQTLMDKFELGADGKPLKYVDGKPIKVTPEQVNNFKSISENYLKLKKDLTTNHIGRFSSDGARMFRGDVDAFDDFYGSAKKILSDDVVTEAEIAPWVESVDMTDPTPIVQADAMAKFGSEEAMKKNVALVDSLMANIGFETKKLEALRSETNPQIWIPNMEDPSKGQWDNMPEGELAFHKATITGKLLDYEGGLKAPNDILARLMGGKNYLDTVHGYEVGKGSWKGIFAEVDPDPDTAPPKKTGLLSDKAIDLENISKNVHDSRPSKQLGINLKNDFIATEKEKLLFEESDKGKAHLEFVSADTQLQKLGSGFSGVEKKNRYGDAEVANAYRWDNDLGISYLGQGKMSTGPMPEARQKPGYQQAEELPPGSPLLRSKYTLTGQQKKITKNQRAFDASWQKYKNKDKKWVQLRKQYDEARKLLKPGDPGYETVEHVENLLKEKEQTLFAEYTNLVKSYNSLYGSHSKGTATDKKYNKFQDDMLKLNTGIEQFQKYLKQSGQKKNPILNQR